MYNCGLTVYDYAHVGNLRAYTFADILRRYLEYKGYTVKQVMNFTDVGHMVGDADASEEAEDKMAKAAQREKKSVWQIADFYIKKFLEDCKIMNFEEPMVRPRATEHIKEMIELTQKLIENGYAYIANGSVYFDISKFKNYGKLSGNTIKNLEAGAGGRVDFNEDKKNQLDFALWVKDPEHVMKWESPWSVGYPGWHIECSAMSSKYLGKSIDIHTGGVDNIFPHHECEIAQSEGASKKKFVKYWMHVSHLQVNSQKMSKSLNNFYTLSDIMKKGYSPKALRYLLLSAHYRTQLNLTDEALASSEKTLKNLIDFMNRLKEFKVDKIRNKKLSKTVIDSKKSFEKHMDDDLNISHALAAIFNLVSETNKAMIEGKISKENKEEILEAMKSFDKLLGVLEQEKLEITPKINKLLKEREIARKEKKFKEADKIRDELKKMGYEIEDSPTGPRLKKIILS